MSAVQATYRLQLQPGGLTLDGAVDLLDYLDDLGVSHLYLSPILGATSGSTHGYDVTDTSAVSAGLGGRAALERLSAAARTRGMGLIVDIVPNHMGIARAEENAWWWDVLSHGRRSRYASYFDIDWDGDNGADGALALPVLGSAEDVSALAIDRSGDVPVLTYHEHRFPVAAGTDGPDPQAVHDAQHYRLVPWTSGVVGYRRFFSVSELAGLRQEDPEVFAATHREVADWVHGGLVDGVRIDHPDGLARPATYLAWLRELLGPECWIVVEKVLGRGEVLDGALPVQGTTGYDALAQYGGVFVDSSGAPGLTALSVQTTGTRGDRDWLETAARDIARTVAATTLAPEVGRAVRAVRRDAADCDSPPPPVGHPDPLREAVVEVLADMPVYRSDYPSLDGLTGRIVRNVLVAHPEWDRELSLLAQALAADGEAAVRFQQVCGALEAKSVEDCLFYRAARLVSLQEVGGDPGTLGISPAEFHLAAAARAAHRPAAMTTLSTHDTKRGEDVRARIGVLSQVPDLWARCVQDWEELAPGPDSALGAFLWQNMFGVWPADGTDARDVPDLRDRLHAYALKSAREAGTRTSWATVDAAFEAALHDWIDTVLDGRVGHGMSSLAHQLAPHAWSDALGQKLLHLTGPGVPDVYQGSELWEDSLVDPDNRRPVDWVRRAAVAERVRAADATPAPSDPAAKFHLVRQALRLRRERPDWFVGGSYTAVLGQGPAATHLVAAGRGPADGDTTVLALATRHSIRLSSLGWRDSTVHLPAGSWTDRIGGRTYAGNADVPLTDIFAALPVALLTRH
ncbi:malto-oligosyltrehalose synthase [Rhodococcus triatomae]|uniref:(1->4)-alpha-D-glucan 1-alpha-D-glucosylmutase n=1 Tax=Rhodococcus triatomae TaxID=300028 RepID=A0A1G8CXG1_9NOCA|nr:malto-oligosyltrehalose synthase [Rhodococcus triatomae]QNG18555.1 malto-oligosyltrehalose synthase [Rhodococcus triatomae]QNG21776.1 malto-oligosyltrehalose synthase [Rhodococcus triatomae]SDH50267.1 (1->4)-alpha-D-glucan 1-alpha-D-glucosylmutase [Rhodococcus triatomae]